MEKAIETCICGGGNIAHSVAAALACFRPVAVLTRQPEKWSSRLVIEWEDGKFQECKHPIFSTSDASIVSGAKFVFICLPRFAIDDLLLKIDAHIKAGQVVVFCPAPAGLSEVVRRFSARGVGVIGLQRVPYVARIKEYGRCVWMGAIRSENRFASSSAELAALWKDYFEGHFVGGRACPLNSFLTLTFSNSNPLLHPSRLVELLRNGKDGVYSKCPYFYAEWTDRSSELYVNADAEMFEVFKAFSSEAAAADYESALSHYESSTPAELTRKIRGIASLRPILAPWKQLDSGLWAPDFSSRYFTEDIPFGTKVIQKYARKVGVKTPTIDYLVNAIGEACK